LGTGTSYVNIHGQTGLVVPPRDPAALARAINRLLGAEQLRTQMGTRASERARQEFSHEVMIDRILGIYADLE
jgi:glycosyltransferase involved in cell wall biosynthesis